MDPGIAVAAAGLDRAQGDVGIFREPAAHHATGRARAAHDDVELGVEFLL
jgi:hypothetical protein